MIAGHFGLAAGVKGEAPAVPLWALMLATVWLDVWFVPLLVAGVETVQTAPGTSGGYGTGIIHADYTHSLLGALVLSAVLGLLVVRRWGRRAAIVLAAVAFSHWVLDLLVHRQDLPLLPGNAGDLPRWGFGLWQAPVVSALVELVLVAVGAYLYGRAASQVSTRSADRHLVSAGGGRGAAPAPAEARTRTRLSGAVMGWLVLAAGVLTLAVDFFIG